MLFTLWCPVQDMEFDYIGSWSLYFCLHFTNKRNLDLLNLINNVGKMKNDIFTISQAAKFKKNGNFCKIMDTEDTKNKEFIDLRKKNCLRKYVSLTFQN